MAQTRQEIEARFRQDNPQVRVLENGIERVLTETEYNAMMAEWATREEARQLRQERRATFTTESDDLTQLEALLPKLTGAVALTPEETKLVLRIVAKDLLQRCT